MSNNESFAKAKEIFIETDDKKSMTVTFITNLQGTILSMQLICDGKASKFN